MAALDLIAFATLENIVIMGAFVLIVFLLYRILNMLMRGTLAAIAGFAFPWIVKFFNLPFPIQATLEASFLFAALGLGLFLIYEFYSFMLYFLKILLWPAKQLFGKKRKVIAVEEHVKQGDKA